MASVEDLHQLVYVSCPRANFGSSDVVDIFEKSRKKNALYGITGVLLFRPGSLLQVLEGRAQSVSFLYDLISQDPRHSRVIQIYQRPTRTRDFPEWSMGFRDLANAKLSNLGGTNKLLEADFDLRELDALKAQCLIREFRA